MKVLSTSPSALPGVEAGAAGPASDGFTAMLEAVLAVPNDPAAIPVAVPPATSDLPQPDDDEATGTEPSSPEAEGAAVAPAVATADVLPVMASVAPAGTGPALVGGDEEAAVVLPKVADTPEVPTASPPTANLAAESGSAPVAGEAPTESPASPQPSLVRAAPVAPAPAAPQLATGAVVAAEPGLSPEGATPTVSATAVEPAEAMPPELPSMPRETGTAPPLATAQAPAAPAPLDAAAPARAAAPPPPPPPMEQLHPVIARLATSGDEGVHRLTVRLHPEELGPVQITVTVRDGAVQVSLAALDDAQAVLQSGTAELRRMLEDAGLSAVDVDVQGGFDERDRDQHRESAATGNVGGTELAVNVSDPRPRRSADSGAVDLRL